MEVKSTKSIGKGTGYSAILYGKSGIGKTYMATLLEDPLVLDLEGGVTSLIGLDVPFLDVNIENIDEAIDTARTSKYKTIIFDSYTMLESMLLTSYADKSKTDTPTLQDYGKLNMALQKYLLKLRDIRFSNKNVVLTALDHIVKVEESDHSFNTMAYPLIMARKGALIQKLVGDVDVVAHLEFGEKQRFLRLKATDNIFAKTRIHTESKILPGRLFEATAIQAQTKEPEQKPIKTEELVGENIDES